MKACLHVISQVLVASEFGLSTLEVATAPARLKCLHGMIAPPELGHIQVSSCVKSHALCDQGKLCPAYVRPSRSCPRDGISRLTVEEPDGPARSARQCGDEPSAVRDSQIRSRGTNLERRANHPRQAPVPHSCDPARYSRRTSSPAPSPSSFSSNGATCGRSPPRGAGRRAHWTGTSCGMYMK